MEETPVMKKLHVLCCAVLCWCLKSAVSLGLCPAICPPAGLQAQTAECLVVGEIAARNMVVALNKIDQVIGKQHDTTVNVLLGMVQNPLLRGHPVPCLCIV